MFVMAMLAVLAADGQHFTKKVRIDGQVYRVTVRGERVEVANKSIIVAREPLRERDARRRAVFEGTGCTLTDELRQGAILIGRLDCRQQVGRESQ